MHKIIATLMLTLLLSSCSFFQIQRLPVQQGNIITPELVSQLHKGMSESEVRQVMGNPVILNVFTPNRIEYVYTYQLGTQPRVEHRVSLIFENDKVITLSSD